MLYTTRLNKLFNVITRGKNKEEEEEEEEEAINGKSNKTLYTLCNLEFPGFLKAWSFLL